MDQPRNWFRHARAPSAPFALLQVMNPLRDLFAGDPLHGGHRGRWRGGRGVGAARVSARCVQPLLAFIAVAGVLGRGDDLALSLF